MRSVLLMTPYCASNTGRTRKGAERLNQTICEVWFDAPPGEDAAAGIWAGGGGTREMPGQEAWHVRLPRFNAHLYTQPKREVHSPRADHAQAAPTEPESSRSMVPGAHARSCGPATK